MDLPPWPDVAGGGPAAPAPPPGPAAADARLAAVEARLAELTDKVDALTSSLEATLRETVAKDVERAAADLRHTVSELGRLLVKDLGRLSRILAEHRDSIVAEITGRPPTGDPPPELTLEAAAEAPAVEIPVADGTAKADDQAEGGDAGGWRGGRRRRRAE